MMTRGGKAEWQWATAIMGVAVTLRLAFVTAFPTRPVSDFRAIVDLAIALRDGGPTAGGSFLYFHNIGTSALLALIGKLVPADPGALARVATALATSGVALLPYFVWRGVVGRPGRIVAALLLAIWPGQVVFSGVAAQDNWALLPVVALACLAVRTLLRPTECHPLWAAALFALGVAIRQELLFVLPPLALASVGWRAGWQRRLGTFAAATALLLVGLAGHRALATGRFALWTEHKGLAVLGSYMPDVGAGYWRAPYAFLAYADPALLDDPARIEQETGRLAGGELRRRPGFHLLRMLSGVIGCWTSPDGFNLYWSLGDPDALPDGRRPAAAAFRAAARWPLTLWNVLMHAAFVAALVTAVRRRHGAIAAIVLTMVLKVAIHALIVTQPRFFVPVVALELLVIGLAVDAWVRRDTLHRASLALVAGALAVVPLFVVSHLLEHRLLGLDEREPQRSYRFPLHAGPTRLDCRVERGRLWSLDPHEATLKLTRSDPAPGDIASAVCALAPGAAPAALALRIHDPWQPGEHSGHILQRVTVDGRTLWTHEIGASPGVGWSEVPLGAIGPESRIVVEVVATRPVPGRPRGFAGVTGFQLTLR